MALDRPTSEALRPVGDGEVGNSGVVDTGRIVAVQGPGFYKDFVQSAVVPVRREVAIAYAAQMLVKDGKPSDVSALIEDAFAFADEFCLNETTTLEKQIGKYFAKYMERGNMDDLISSQIADAKDYTL